MIKFYYKNKVSHKEAYEKFNIKKTTYFTYLKLYKDNEFTQTGGNKKYEEFEKTNNIFKKKEKERTSDILEVMNNLGKEEIKINILDLPILLNNKKKITTTVRFKYKKGI